VYRTLESLVRSYMAPNIDQTGRVKGYGMLDLRRLRRVDWRATTRSNVSTRARATSRPASPTAATGCGRDRPARSRGTARSRAPAPQERTTLLTLLIALSNFPQRIE
jgi:hypothetical protein